MFNDSDFGKRFEQARKYAIVSSIIGAILGLGTLGFFMWVIVKVMQHFHVIG